MINSLFLTFMFCVASAVSGTFDTSTIYNYQDTLLVTSTTNSAKVVDNGVLYQFESYSHTLNKRYFYADAIDSNLNIYYEYASINVNLNTDVAVASQDVKCWVLCDYDFVLSNNERERYNAFANYPADSEEYLYFLFWVNTDLRYTYIVDITYVHIDTNNAIGYTLYSHNVINNDPTNVTNGYQVAKFDTCFDYPSRDYSYDFVNIIITTVGNPNGYNTGYTTGYDDGYGVGFLDGQNQTNYSFFNLFSAIADTPILFVRSIFNFDLFGMNMYVVILSLLTSIVIIHIIRKIV